MNAEKPDSGAVERPVCILVLGMHRSGTSVVTRVLSQMGATLPKTLMPPAEDNNELGFWEPQRLMEINDRLLAEAGSRWDDWRPFRHDSLPAGRLEAYRQEIERTITSEFGTSPLIVIKEPRISRLSELYRDILERIGYRVEYILVGRNPLDVAKSIYKRDGFTVGFSALLWLRHELDAESATRSSRRALISFEHFLQDWRSSIAAVTDQLDIKWPRSIQEASTEIDGTVSPDHHHHRATLSDLVADRSISSWATEAYRARLQLEASPLDPTALSTLDQIKREFDAALNDLGDPVFQELDIRWRLGAAKLAELDDKAKRMAERVTRMQRSIERLTQENNELVAQEREQQRAMSKLQTLKQLTAKGLATWRREGLGSATKRTISFARRHLVGSAATTKATSAQEWDQTFVFKNDEGATNARRPASAHDFAIKTPFTVSAARSTDIAVVIHAFYTEYLHEILSGLRNINSKFSLYISTVDDGRKAKIVEICHSLGIFDFEIRVFPNRGRDIAPKIVGFRDVYDRHEYFLHLHTKKSPHSAELDSWRGYLLRQLLGRPEIVESALALLSRSEIGIVFPQHLPALRGSLNWGYDYNAAQTLLARIGVPLSRDSILEFPSGSMFWGKSAALRPLLDLKLSFDDFPQEMGQVDGTLAHAVERTYLRFAERAGYKWLKIHDGVDYPWPETLLSAAPAEIDESIARVWRPLFEEHSGSELAVGRSFPEVRPLRLRAVAEPRQRLNLLLPTIRPSSVFGGISTALSVFRELGAARDSFDLRIIALDDYVEPDHVAKQAGFSLAKDATQSVIGLFDRSVPLDVTADDVFITTSWWSEHLCAKIRDFQSGCFGRARRSVYLIQDYEPNFVQWSSRWALAEATYRDPEVVAIVNSEELSQFFGGRHDFRTKFTLPYVPNRVVAASFESAPKERLVLCYGRPSVTRNCFEILVDGVALWQQRNPVLADDWKIVFLGEDFPAGWAHPVQNAVTPGKVDLVTYADYLSRASVGISLMTSPHPSYPPLEMAASDLFTISNDYEAKQISRRCPDRIVGLTAVTPEALAGALTSAVASAEARIGCNGERRTIEALPFEGATYEPNAVWEALDRL